MEVQSERMRLPSGQQLVELFLQKHGNPDSTGWAPKRRFRFNFFTPADIYEATVENCIIPGVSWLDVGGGHQLFPENPQLAHSLVSRCSNVTAVDPSDNVHRNQFVHTKHQCLLEHFQTTEQFDIATMRMVVEHVANPAAFIDALSDLLKPGGIAIVFTVNAWSPITMISRFLPFGLHHPIKRMFWGGEEEDTFPVQYKMNTRKILNKHFATAGFEEAAFAKLDDLSTFGRFRILNYGELLAWKLFHSLGLNYPENCLLGIYKKRLIAP